MVRWTLTLLILVAITAGCRTPKKFDEKAWLEQRERMVDLNIWDQKDDP